jgi:inhibitor of KinA sporulation pathway (predicted exonuclease)
MTKLPDDRKGDVSMNAKLGLPEQFVLFDLEWTTWEGAAARNWSGEHEHREVVQCGALLVGNGLVELASAMHYVRPTANPTLSDYFINLTHITQADIDNKGVDFRTFINDFYAWCKDLELYAFEDIGKPAMGDVVTLMESCRLNGMPFPFGNQRFHNVNEIFHEHGVHVEQSGAAPEAFGLELPARPHHALNDARGLLIGLQELAKLIGSYSKNTG